MSRRDFINLTLVAALGATCIIAGRAIWDIIRLTWLAA